VKRRRGRIDNQIKPAAFKNVPASRYLQYLHDRQCDTA
jgi:hypothetical protein